MLCDGQNSRNLVLLREFGFESPFSQFVADKKKKWCFLISKLFA